MIINVVPLTRVQTESAAPHLTWHARQRMTTLGFTSQDVLSTVVNPEWTRPNGHQHPQNCVVCVGPELLVVWDPRTREVLTVMLRSDERYEHGIHSRGDLPVAA